MKNRDFKKIAESSILRKRGFVFYKNIYFVDKFAEILSGIAFESTSHEMSEFYVRYFFIPLYVPTDVFYFNHGDRLFGANGNVTMQRWTLSDSWLIEHLDCALSEQAVPFIERALSANGVEAALNLIRRSEGLMALEAIAYSNLRNGQYAKAREILASLRGDLEREAQSGANDEALQRILLILSLLKDDASKAQNRLDDWVQESVKNLKLEKYWSGRAAPMNC